MYGKYEQVSSKNSVAADMDLEEPKEISRFPRKDQQGSIASVQNHKNMEHFSTIRNKAMNRPSQDMVQQDIQHTIPPQIHNHPQPIYR